MYNKTVSINLDSRCNASCDHCCFSSSPTSTTRMEKEYIRELVTEFAKNKTIQVISFTGGEVFLDYKFLKELMEIIKPYEKQITLISNGFWGMSKKKVQEYFHDMNSLNVIALTISYDEYHAPFVKSSSIKNILEHSRKYPDIDISLNMAVTKDKMSNHILEDLGDSILGVKITKFPMISVGAAKTRIKQENIHKFYSLEDEDSLHCPGYDIVYHHDGEIYPCCSPAIFETKITLREEYNQSFERTVEKLNSNLLLFILRKEGFKWFLNILKENNKIEEFDIPYEFSSICGVCGSLFNSAEKINYFYPYMEKYYNENFKV
ncbi:YydG family radical SAM peptide epimerase [Bacillus subtilis]|uniref:YydG family radical SAM peptide epimerase n=1 Tax=Bacillus subtilis TaxID=1423 RepID=UPI00164B65C5|nr:YydG family radical SAM peptide epimerase [Bacillus subtilis]QNK36771.1 YydG family peptide radical SAM peptide maturase [Bacillus subtilis subsp. subtilis]